MPHTREPEFLRLAPRETRVPCAGLPFTSSASTERAIHSTRVPLFVVEHLSPCPGSIRGYRPFQRFAVRNDKDADCSSRHYGEDAIGGAAAFLTAGACST